MRIVEPIINMDAHMMVVVHEIKTPAFQRCKSNILDNILLEIQHSLKQGIPNLISKAIMKKSFFYSEYALYFTLNMNSFLLISLSCFLTGYQ